MGGKDFLVIVACSYLLFPLLLAESLAPGLCEGSSKQTALCHNAGEFIKALGDASVTCAVVQSDFAMFDVDWSSVRTPVLVRRNMTISGTSSAQEQWPIVDLGFAVGKIQVATGFFLNFKHVVLVRWRKGPHFQAPGLDIVATTAPPLDTAPSSAWPHLLFHDMAWLQRGCLEPALARTFTNTSTRPPFVPGKQTISSNQPQPGCRDDPDAHPMARCRPLFILYNDLVMFAHNLRADKMVEPAGYVLWLQNTWVKCEKVITKACVEEYGSPLGCFYKLFPDNEISGTDTKLPNASPPASKGAAEPTEGDCGSLSVLGPILGGVFAGMAAAALAAGAVIYMRHRRLRAKQADKDSIKMGTASTRIKPSSRVPCSSTIMLTSDQLRLSGPQEPNSVLIRTDTGGLPCRGPSLVLVTPDTPLQPGINLRVQIVPVPHPYGCSSLSIGATGGGRGNSVRPKGGSGSGPKPTLDSATGGGPGGGPGSGNSSSSIPAAADAAVVLLPTTLGKGAFGRVVQGLYGGQLVAVKLLNEGLMAGMAAARQAPPLASHQPLQPLTLPPETQGLMTDTRPMVAAPAAAQQQPDTEPQPAPLPAARAMCETTRASHSTGFGPSSSSHDGPLAPGPLTSAGMCLGGTDPPLPLGMAPHVASPEIAVAAAAETAGAGENAATTNYRPGAPGRGSESPETKLQTMQPQSPVLLVSATGDTGEMEGSARAAEAPAGGAVAVGAAAGSPTSDGEPPGGLEDHGPAEPQNALERSLAQEVQVLARLHHPNIVRLLAACLTPPQMCLVIELMETSLERLLYGSGPAAPLMPLDKVLYIAAEVANGLAYLHPTVIHRDLKPANILLVNACSHTPVVKLADFGLSRLQTSILITAHANAGTVPYMAPELLDAMNIAATHHVDVYALGVILYEMVSGMRPWAGLPLVQVAVAVGIGRQRPSLDQLDERRCPPRLRALIEQCWDQVAQRRPAACELVKELWLLRDYHHNHQEKPPHPNPGSTSGPQVPQGHGAGTVDSSSSVDSHPVGAQVARMSKWAEHSQPAAGEAF